MTIIILQTMPATESGGMVFRKLLDRPIELQQCSTIAEAQSMAKAMIERAKQAGQGATILALVYGRKPNGWNKAKQSFYLNTFN